MTCARCAQRGPRGAGWAIERACAQRARAARSAPHADVDVDALAARVAPSRVARVQVRARHRFVLMLTNVAIFFWSFPITLTSALGTLLTAPDSRLLRDFFMPVALLAGGETSLYFETSLARLAVVALQLGLLTLVPIALTAVGERWEGAKTYSTVQRTLLRSYTAFSLINVYVTVLAPSGGNALYSYVQSAVRSPRDVLDLAVGAVGALADALPRVAAYCCELLIAKALIGLPLEFARPWPLLQWAVATRCGRRRPFAPAAPPGAAAADADGAPAAPRASAHAGFVPPPFYGFDQLEVGWVLPPLVMSFHMAALYAVISPLLLPVTALYFGLAALVLDHNARHAYRTTREGGAMWWPTAVSMVVWGLGGSQLLLIAYLAIRQAYAPAALCAPLPALSWRFLAHLRRKHAEPAAFLALDAAARRDAEVRAAGVQPPLRADYYRPTKT